MEQLKAVLEGSDHYQETLSVCVYYCKIIKQIKHVCAVCLPYCVIHLDIQALVGAIGKDKL